MKTKPMKEKEFREAANCAHCGNLIGASGIPFFYRITVEAHVVISGALNCQSGLESIFGGNVALAQVFSPNEDMTKPLHEEIKTITICHSCAMGKIMLIELANLCNGELKIKPENEITL